jgi:hypothetical protein
MKIDLYVPTYTALYIFLLQSIKWTFLKLKITSVVVMYVHMYARKLVPSVKYWCYQSARYLLNLMQKQRPLRHSIELVYVLLSMYTYVFPYFYRKNNTY